MQKIIVGYDGSVHSHAAFAWALDEASRTAATVELVYADEWPVLAPAANIVTAPPLRPDTPAVQVINGTLEHAVATARRTHPLVLVTARTMGTRATAALTDLSRQAHLVVVGGRGNSAVTALGSVSAAVSAHAHCPVIVVRGEAPATAPVVAGIDGSPAAPQVLTFAAEQAAERKVPLHVVRTWPPVTGLWEETPMVTNTVTGPEREEFDRLVGGLDATFPGLVIEAEATVAHPVDALERASTQAQLLVVGSRGHGSVSGLLLGSVSQHLLRSSHCTIAVVHRDI